MSRTIGNLKTTEEAAREATADHRLSICLDDLKVNGKLSGAECHGKGEGRGGGGGSLGIAGLQLKLSASSATPSPLSLPSDLPE